MKIKKTIIHYWFTIEPYVYIGLTSRSALLYNTLDREIIESDKVEVIELLREVLLKDNCGVVLLSHDRYQNIDIKIFINILREKYMGDIIDVNLSIGKPIQHIPFFNLQIFNKLEIYKKQNFPLNKNALKNLHEISIHVDNTVNIVDLISVLQSLPLALAFNIVGNIMNVENYQELLSFFNLHPSRKIITCSYTNITPLSLDYNNNYSYKLLVDFPIQMSQWYDSIQILNLQKLPFEYEFKIRSDEDFLYADKLIEEFQIDKYLLKPVYTGENIQFFENNIFLSKSDILSIPLSMKDLFTHQVINIYDFGKINIMPNGDVYANINQQALGNIYADSIYEIVLKEIDKGTSWFRIRNQAPCNDCVYQWLCPSPSNYEIEIDRPNLCNIKI
jgi:pseudo-rSAM protein